MASASAAAGVRAIANPNPNKAFSRFWVDGAFFSSCCYTETLKLSTDTTGFFGI